MDLPKISENSGYEAQNQEAFQESVKNKFFKELETLHANFNTELKNKEEHEQAIYDMMNDIQNRTRKEIDHLQKERKEGQNNLMDLLESTVVKLNSALNWL